VTGRPPGVRVRLDGEATGGAFCLLELVLEPEGGAEFHAHTREDETIAVVEGALVVETDGGSRALSPGDSVFLARGVRHAFRA
jgi:quercetin dioxygenase-like cupin family protein